MANPIRVAAAQMSSTTSVSQNLETIAGYMQEAAARGANVVVFPEAAMANFTSDLMLVAQPLDGPFASAIREMATRLGIITAVGMFTPGEDERVRNTVLVVGPEVDTHYDKIHLFDAFYSRESELVEPGTRQVTFQACGTSFGLATCFDLRFASQFSELGRAGARILLVPASWGEGPGKAEQWDLLTCARAADAQAWLVGCDQAWMSPNGQDPLGVGRSTIVNPLGAIHARLDHKPGLLLADIDPTSVDEVRRNVPIL